MARKTPIRHRVRLSLRKGKAVSSHDRGSGSRTTNPHSNGYTPPKTVISDEERREVMNKEPARLELRKQSFREKLRERFGKRDLEKERKEKLNEKNAIAKYLLL